MSNFFSNNLKFLRKQAGKSQSDLGFQLKKAHTSVGNWEKGVSEPSLKEIEELARIFEITPATLLFSDLSAAGLDIKKGNEQSVQLHSASAYPDPQKGAEERESFLVNEGESPAYHADPKNTLQSPKVVTVTASGGENAVYVSVQARADYITGYENADFIGRLPAYNLPDYPSGSYRIFETEGFSMFPTLQDGDKVVTCWVQLAEVQQDKIYVLVTKEKGLLIRRILNRPGEGILIGKSDNNQKGEYPDVVLETSKIAECWQVVERWTKTWPDPGEIYQRLVDLEADMALIKKKLLNE